MKRHISILLVVATMLCNTFVLSAQPLWMTQARISPDGGSVVFCYKGDIFTVPSKGGEAVRLTTLDSYETNPVWSPDGKQIAFTSNRYGSFDIYVMDACGGTPARVTFSSFSKKLWCFDPSGENLYFSANIQDPAQSALFPSSALGELYSVPVGGGKVSQVLATPAENVCFAADGKSLLYQDRKGVENVYRKHHISSVTRDVWSYDFSTGKHTNLTNRAGEDLCPVFGPDGKTVYCISEPPATPDGRPIPEGWQTSLNVYALDGGVSSSMKKISSFEKHPVRDLSIAGDVLCYCWNGEIYTQKIGSDPVKLDVRMVADEQELVKNMSASSGADESCVSPDGKQIAFILRGEVFVTSVEYATTKQITHTAAAERHVSFKDDRTLVYTSERDGVKQIYKASIVREEDPDFPNATLISEEAVLADLSHDRSHPCYSPDGKVLAFVQDRNILCLSKNGKVREMTSANVYPEFSDDFSYRWSPDSKWITFLYVPNKHDPYYDVALMDVESGNITNITQSGYMVAGCRFVMGGNAIMFADERYGMRSHASWGSQNDIFLCFLNQETMDRFKLSKEELELVKAAESKDKKKDEKKEDKVADVKVELDGIQDRIVRLTPNSSNLGDAILTSDGETLYYTASFEKGMDLWKMTLRTRETKLVSKGAGYGSFDTSADGKTIFYLGNGFKKLSGDSFTSISFNAKYKLDAAAEREAMFDYVCREEAKRFYTPDMHGVDWTFYCNEYRRFLPHIDNNFDFSNMLSELLGELNVSHTGSGYYSDRAGESTGNLGLLYDLTYSGKGLKIAEVVSGGPFDRAQFDVAAGDVILTIDGVEITDSVDITSLLGGKVGSKVLVGFKGKKEYVVKPVSNGQMSDLMYRRWVKAREADVDRLSGGRLGYVHIKSMSDPSFRTMYSDILGKFNDRDGIVIDTRFNGGGRMHEDIEILFSGYKYLTQVVRGIEACDMPSRRWNKPSIMIQCESNYSNAHGTPWVYKTMGIGKLVGAPVPGTMTSVNWQTLQDESMYFGIPVIGYRTAEGYYLENSQLEPDIYILNDPEIIVTGRDQQLEAAVTELLKEIDAK